MQGKFSGTSQYLGVSDSRGMALGDIDGDGDIDAVIVSDRANIVMTNDGLGNFSYLEQTEFGLINVRGYNRHSNSVDVELAVFRDINVCSDVSMSLSRC